MHFKRGSVVRQSLEILPPRLITLICNLVWVWKSICAIHVPAPTCVCCASLEPDCSGAKLKPPIGERQPGCSILKLQPVRVWHRLYFSLFCFYVASLNNEPGRNTTQDYSSQPDDRTHCCWSYVRTEKMYKGQKRWHTERRGGDTSLLFTSSLKKRHCLLWFTAN